MSVGERTAADGQKCYFLHFYIRVCSIFPHVTLCPFQCSYHGFVFMYAITRLLCIKSQVLDNISYWLIAAHSVHNYRIWMPHQIIGINQHVFEAYLCLKGCKWLTSDYRVCLCACVHVFTKQCNKNFLMCSSPFYIDVIQCQIWYLRLLPVLTKKWNLRPKSVTAISVPYHSSLPFSRSLLLLLKWNRIVS